MAGELPQTGWHTDIVWAAAFDEEVSTFRKKCQEHKIPRRRWGNVIVVRAEDLFSHMATEGMEATEED